MIRYIFPSRAHHFLSIPVKTEPPWEVNGSGTDVAATTGSKQTNKSGRSSDPNRRSSSPDPYEFPDDDDDNRDPSFGGGDPGFGPEDSLGKNSGGKAEGEASPEKDAALKEAANQHKGGAAQYKIETQLLASYKGSGCMRRFWLIRMRLDS